MRRQFRYEIVYSPDTLLLTKLYLRNIGTTYEPYVHTAIHDARPIGKFDLTMSLGKQFWRHSFNSNINKPFVKLKIPRTFIVE